MPAIDILMAAYNGERYISEQIESILSQTFTDWRLLIRDDGSTDNTPAIIEDYAAKYPGKIEIVHDDAVCRRPEKNFFELLKHAEADYVMFSDQDDYWLKYKIQITLDYIKDAELENPEKPVMVFTGLEVVDAELKSTGELMSLEFPERRYSFRELLAGNYAAGCTQMLNRECYEGMGRFQEGIFMHDWWASLYASAFGVIVRVPMALILYRQHGNNSIGAGKNYPRGIERLIKILKNPIKKARNRIHITKSIILHYRRMNSVFRSRYYESLNSAKKNDCDDYNRMFSGNIFARFSLVRTMYYFSNLSKMDTIGRLLWIFLPRP